MVVVPAIDIRGGKCVRLFQGDYARETVFGDRPSAIARRWLDEGACALHLVDLDGARSGRSENESAVVAVLKEVRSGSPLTGERVVVQLGGGIRELSAIERWLEAGLDRVIIGTAAIETPELIDRGARAFPGRVWVGIDTRQGIVAVQGWTRTTGRSSRDLAIEAQERGAGGIVYTDIGRDGTGRGVNAEATVALATGLRIPVYASGGVRSREDVARLRATADSGIEGVIVGRALYDGTATLADLIAAAS